MELLTSYNQTKILYEEHLNLIKGIKFTYREIDIIACIIHNRGEKKIALLLSLSPRTVGTHIHNIMLKLGCNSREYIIDFIEKSGKLLPIKQYYILLLLQLAFRKQLIRVGKELNKSCVIKRIKHEKLSLSEVNLLNQLKEHLKLANVTVVDCKPTEEADIYLVNSEFSSKQKKTAHNIFIIFDAGNKYLQNINGKCIDFSQKDKYHFLVFELLSKIIQTSLLAPIVKEFAHEYQVIVDSWNGTNKDPRALGTVGLLAKKLTSKSLNVLLTGVLGFGMMVSLFVFQKAFNPGNITSQENISYDLPLPHDSMLLDRTAILTKINEKLTGKNIQVIALVGPGGSGKTTIARQYARSKKTPLSWEINAETQDTILSSFEQLAYLLCQTEDDKNEVQIIQEMKDVPDKKSRLHAFLTRRIRNYENWIIIYNNVESFKDISHFFPYDSKVWGQGKVIITTRNSNIGHNNHIPNKNVIKVEELTQEEKVKLFSDILNNGKNLTVTQDTETIEFLRQIPPFPLDVSIAAYYIKEENISYSEYLSYLIKPNDDFISVQETILQDIGQYNKTRYDIITLSVKRVIDANPDFIDILLFISLIDNQNIPKDLLTIYKGDITVSKFMRELRKYSLITEKPEDAFTTPVFSIHHDTQKISLAYLLKISNLKDTVQQLNAMSEALGKYANNELGALSYSKSPLFINHAEIFLEHKKLLDKVGVADLTVELGNYYFLTANYKKAKALFEQALKVYNKQYGPNHAKAAWALTRLGVVYRNMEDYKTAKELLEKALGIYKRSHNDYCVETAWVSTYLGSVYTNNGEYGPAKLLLEKALKIYNKDNDGNYLKIAWVSSYLGMLHKHMGNYKTAKSLLEKSLEIYKKQFDTDHPLVAWVSVCLGSVHENTGNYNTAKELMEQALAIYKKRYGEQCTETAWALAHLGKIYYFIGDTKKAQELMEQSLKIYYPHFANDHVNIAWVKLMISDTYQEKKNYRAAQELLEEVYRVYQKFYGKEHIHTARVLNSLGKVKLMNNDFIAAEDLFNEALIIFRQDQHPKAYMVLKNLGDLYTVKAQQALNSKNITNHKFFGNLAIKHYEESLELINKIFINNHPQAMYIKSKLVDLYSMTKPV